MADPRAPTGSVTTHDSPPPSSRLSTGEDTAALVLVHSPDAAAVGRATHLGEARLVAGRDVEGAGLSVRDPQLSRVHFRIGRDPRTHRMRLGDAQSRNGTLVDGVRVDSVELEGESVIRAGETIFVRG